jgi:hypothetical protein
MGTRYWPVYESDVNDVVLAKLEGYSEVFWLLGKLASAAKGSVQFLIFTEEISVYFPRFGPVDVFWTGGSESGVSYRKSGVRGAIDGEDWFLKKEFGSLICYSDGFPKKDLIRWGIDFKMLDGESVDVSSNGVAECYFSLETKSSLTR